LFLGGKGRNGVTLTAAQAAIARSAVSPGGLFGSKG